MKRFLSLIMCLLVVTMSVACQPVTPNIPSSETALSEELSSEAQSSEAQASEQENSAAQASDPQKLLAQMTLEQKVYQMFFVRPENLVGVDHLAMQLTAADEALLAALQEMPVGGVAMFGGNIIFPNQTKKMIAAMQEQSNIPLFIGVDEEGGLVARVGNNPDMGTTAFPDMMTVTETGGRELAYDVGYTIGTELLPFGFNLDFAPVADVATNPVNSVIGRRAFSSDAKTAANMLTYTLDGFADAGMITVLKHFPGHGDTAEDSHTESAVTYKTYDEMAACEWIPFSVGIQSGADMVMVGHIVAPNVDDSGLPATFSSYLLQEVLRKDLAFDGVIITDSMEMAAIAADYTPDVSVVMAVKAGVDIILMPTDLKLAALGILKAVEHGELTEARIDESVLRILTLKEKYGLLP